AEEKAKAGAFATFLGITMWDPDQFKKTTLFEKAASLFRKHDPPQVWKWRGIAVGDSCAFQIRDDKLITSFPISNAGEFNSRPILLCSNPANNTGVWPEVRIQEGDCKVGDLFILATDAVAKWFLDQYEAGGKP